MSDGRTLKSRDVIDYINDNFDEEVSSGSYDDIRRKHLKLSVEARVVVPTAPGAARNAPNRGYAVSDEHAAVVRLYGRPEWPRKLAEFQDLIRDRFPVFGEERGIQFGLAGSQPIMATNEPSWQFKSQDENWVVSLTSSFLALTSVTYRDFASFLSYLGPVVEAFERTYLPPFYTRVGLRYVNRFILVREGEERICWEELLNDHLSAAQADPVLKESVTECNHFFLLQSDPGQIGWRYSHDIGLSEGQRAERFTIDFDHFLAGSIPCGDVTGLLTGFNDTIYRFFRWCLTNDGYESLGPRPKEG